MISDRTPQHNPGHRLKYRSSHTGNIVVGLNQFWKFCSTSYFFFDELITTFMHLNCHWAAWGSHCLEKGTLASRQTLWKILLWLAITHLNTSVFVPFSITPSYFCHRQNQKTTDTSFGLVPQQSGVPTRRLTFIILLLQVMHSGDKYDTVNKVHTLMGQKSTKHACNWVIFYSSVPWMGQESCWKISMEVPNIKMKDSWRTARFDPLNYSIVEYLDTRYPGVQLLNGYRNAPCRTDSLETRNSAVSLKHKWFTPTASETIGNSYFLSPMNRATLMHVCSTRVPLSCLREFCHGRVIQSFSSNAFYIRM